MHPANFDTPAATWKHRGDSQQLRRENVKRADPDEHRDRAAERPVVAALEKIADGQVAMLDRLAPHARADAEREDQASRCRPTRSTTTR